MTILRDRHCPSYVRIENCHALRFVFDDGAEPVESKRVSDLRAGDVVTLDGQEKTVKSVYLYR